MSNNGVGFFVDDSGSYCGQMDSEHGLSLGLRLVPFAPLNAQQKWDETSGDWTPISLSPEAAMASIAARRYEAETSGTTVEGVPVNTERDSQALLTGAALQAMLDPNYTVRWKTVGGFVDLDAQQIIGLASAVRAHVQACFDREAELVAAVEDGSYAESMLDEGWS